MSDETSAQRLGKLLRDERAEAKAEATQDPELARLMRTVSVLGARSGKARPQRALPWLAGVAVLAAAAVVCLAVLGRRDDLTFYVRGAARLDDRSISAESGEPVQVRFSDGSSFALTPGARLRVENATPDGAHLVLGDGEALASVVHRAGTHWSVAAGPFEVLVVGTRFGARWDAERQHLSVELHEGAVQVRGGKLGAPVALHAGQRLDVSASSLAWRLSPLSGSAEEERRDDEQEPRLAETAQPETPTPSPMPAPTPEARAATGQDKPTSSRVAAVAWRTLMGRSDFATIVEQAETMGVERCFATCTPGNLRILADAARYTGKLELAEQAFSALRRRSPAQAAAAAFFLGRLRESRGQSREALAMYELHLSEAPRSDYAEQAMAGRMRMLVRTGDQKRARSAARSYLDGFPDGVHAESARRVLGGDSLP